MELDIKLQEDIRGFLYYALPLCVLKTNEKYEPWIMENYVHCVCTNYPGFLYRDGVNYINYTSNDVMKISYLDYKIIGKGREIDKIVIDALIEKNYVVIFLDEFYLPEQDSYKKDHFFHEILIYGYDEMYFYYVAFDSKMTFSKLKVPRSCINLAYWKGEEIAWEGCDSFLLLKPLDLWSPYTFSWDRFYKNFCDYRIALDDDKFHALKLSNKDNNDKYYFGIENTRMFIDVLGNPISDLKTGLYPVLHSWYEQKKGLLQRFSYAANQGIDRGLSVLIQEYLEVVNEANAIKNLYIKFNFTKSQETKEKIVNRLDLLFENERKLLDYV